MSTIASVEVRSLAPDVPRFRYTAGDEVYTTTTLVRVVDDDGRAGWGAYDADSHGDWDRAPLETLRTIIPRLPGTDPDDHEGLWSMLTEDGTSPFAPAVRSALDVACWDLCARRRGEPLRLLLGGRADATSLEAYASVPTFDDVDGCLRSIDGWVGEGFGAVKVHAWGDPDRDASLVRAIADRFPDLTLMHDAEGRYDRDGAEVVARACAEAGVRWFEAPLPDLDLEGFRWLRRQVPDVAILAAGDAIWDPNLMAEALRDPAWDAVRFDVSFVGGVTPSLRLLALAAEAGLPAELISYGHTVIQAVNLHVGLAGGRTTFFEQAVPPEPFEHGVVNPIRTGSDGRTAAPEGAGLGIELDEAALEAATLGVVRAERG